MSVLLKALKHAGARNAEAERGGDGLTLEPMGPSERDNRVEPRTDWTTPVAEPPLTPGEIWDRLFGGRSVVYPIAAVAILFLAAYALWVWWQWRPPQPLLPGPAITATPAPAPTPPANIVPAPASPTMSPAEPAVAEVPPTPPAPAASAKPVPRVARALKPRGAARTGKPAPVPAAVPSAEGAADGNAVAEAYAELVAGRYDEALTRYRALTGREPASVDAWLGLAAAAQGSGKFPAAADAWRRALALEPVNVYAQAGLASLTQETDAATAEARLKGLIAARPEAHLYFALGNHYAARSRWADAQVAWFEAVRVNPADPDYSFNLAIALEHIGKPREAARYYAKAGELSTRRGHAGFDPALAAARARALGE